MQTFDNPNAKLPPALVARMAQDAQVSDTWADYFADRQRERETRAYNRKQRELHKQHR